MKRFAFKHRALKFLLGEARYSKLLDRLLERRLARDKRKALRDLQKQQDIMDAQYDHESGGFV